MQCGKLFHVDKCGDRFCDSARRLTLEDDFRFPINLVGCRHAVHAGIRRVRRSEIRHVGRGYGARFHACRNPAHG